MYVTSVFSLVLTSYPFSTTSQSHKINNNINYYIHMYICKVCMLILIILYYLYIYTAYYTTHNARVYV